MRRKLLIVLLCALTLVCALYVLMLKHTNPPLPPHPYFTEQTRRPLAIAHRGGGGLWPENTLEAFRGAAGLGADVLELDVHSTADGTLVVMHDATVERTTDGAGAIHSMTLAELRRLDAGYRFTPDGGRTYPFRGKGVLVPTLAEVFDACPGARFNIEPKQQQPSIVGPLCRMIRERGLARRVLVGSFSASVLAEFRAACPEVATSASTAEVATFLTLSTTHAGAEHSLAANALQVPEYMGGVHVLTRSFVEAAHARDLQVHVWTINRPEDMERILALGVDGIMTDYPDRLLTLLRSKNLR